MDMEKLIELVRDYPVLYDTSHPDYMRSKLKDELWEKLARELNYSDGKAAKEQWRKLRDCHRESLRRQQKKSGQQAITNRPWTYQKQMEFLKQFMKNRTTVGYPSTSALQESLLEDDDIELSEPSFKTNIDETDESTEGATPKKMKPSKISDPVRKYIEDSDKRAKKRDELRQNLAAKAQQESGLHSDALYHFFMSMCNTTKSLPTKYQRQVRRKVFEAVSQAEDDAEDEKQLQINSQSSSSTPLPTSEQSEWLSPQNATTMSPVETVNYTIIPIQEEDGLSLFKL